jgi:two-component system, cell cycle sensor histidine kinase and response regulator CckA
VLHAERQHPVGDHPGPSADSETRVGALEPLERLTGKIAHDFNNLLSVIMSSVDLLEADLAPTDAGVESLRDIRQAARHGAELVKQLAALGRQQFLQPMVVDLSDQVVQLTEALQRTVGDAVWLQLRFDGESACARVDPDQLRSVLLQIAENSRDAMPDGGTLTVDVEAVELAGFDPASARSAPTPCVMVAVSDTGVGMNEHTRAHAFEPCFTTKQGRGGMGLAIVRGIVGQSGGAIWVDSAPGEGTTIACYFPRVTSTSADAIDAIDTTAASSAEGTRILLVDDDAPVRRTVARLLLAEGYTVVQASSPAEALQLVRAQGEGIALILTDVVMPDMSGPELVSELRHSVPNAKVLFMSGHPGEVLSDPDQAHRCVPFLQKPLGKTELLAAVSAALRGQSIRPGKAFDVA